jgi:hypothetical protein
MESKNLISRELPSTITIRPSGMEAAEEIGQNTELPDSASFPISRSYAGSTEAHMEDGPWFTEFRIRTMLPLSSTDC